MSELSMNQVIHAAVRRDVARTERALRTFPGGDADRAVQLQRAWRNLVRELTHHHEAEDALVWPFLLGRGVDPALMASMEGEHGDMKRALAEVSTALDGLMADPTAERAEDAARVVARAGEVVGAHLEHEEADVEPITAGLENDPEWKAVTRKLRPARLVDAANGLAWMQDGADQRELGSLRAHVPGPVVAVLTTVLARRYAREVAPVWR